MKKSINDGVIHTSNGVDTVTNAVYLRQLREYTPREDGYNLELAEDVYALISDNQALWEQGTWRQILQNEEEMETYADEIESDGRGDLHTLQQQINQMAAFKQDTENPTCGTAMCFAGWVAELSGADWVIDASAMRRKGVDLRPSEIAAWSSVLFVSHKEVEELTRGDEDVYDRVREIEDGTFTMDSMDKNLRVFSKERGFTAETHRTMSAEAYASLKLGILNNPDLDIRDELFGGSNRLKDIREILDELAASDLSADA